MSNWYQLDIREVLEKLGSDPSCGLTDLEASRRLKQYGSNELVEQRLKSPWRILWEQLREPLVTILLFAEDEAVVFGGAGDDDLFVTGSNSKIFGNDGSDRFFAVGAGGNTFIGGEGADRFWIAAGELPDSANVIRDFELDIDAIGVGASGISSVDELSFIQDGGDAIIRIADTDVARFLGIEAAELEGAI